MNMSLATQISFESFSNLILFVGDGLKKLPSKNTYQENKPSLF